MADDGDFEVYLTSDPIWIRCHDRPGAVSLFRVFATELPPDSALDAAIDAFNARTIIFRSFLEDGCIVLRADVSGEPFVSDQLRRILETFDANTAAFVEEFATWTD